ncbi:MAG: DNA primase, partial [Candidatus Colwellbacteria bacterium]|nr:DNA primase [Candidatus Colwellbacteria bacterium]
VSPDRQLWYCFGACSDGGDIFKFLMRYENLEFHEALAVLAEKAGIELKRLSPADERQFGILYDINNTAASIFEENLGGSPEILTYLKERGLKPETVKEFDIGFAPPGAENLTVNLINRGFNINDIVRAGLTVKTERGQYRDRFRGRIIFPIHNHFGKIVGFSGRILPQFEREDSAKYLNTPETPIFNKSRLLYGFWQSKKFVRDENTAFLVEGQMDFLLSWQDGVKNVAASSGTALTADHLRVLRRAASKLVLGFDLDEAGQMAAERSIDLGGAHDFTVSIISLGKFSDPAEAARQSPGFLKEAVNSAKPAMEHYFNRYLTTEKIKTIDERKKALRLILSRIKNIWSPVERSHWLRELSHKAGVPERVLVLEMEKLSEEDKVLTPPEARQEARRLERIELVSLQILGLIVLKRDLSSFTESYLEIMPSPYREAYNFIVAPPSQSLNINTEVREIIDFASLRSGIEFADFAEEKIEVELKNLLKELQYEYLKQLREKTSRLVLEAEQSGDEEGVLKHLEQLDEIVKKLHHLRNAKEEKQKVHT